MAYQTITFGASTLNTDLCYTLYYDIENYVAGTITWELGDGAGNWTTVSTNAANGSFSDLIGAVDFAALPSAPLELRFDSSPGNYDVTFNGLYLDDSCTTKICSECFDLQENPDCPTSKPTILITYKNDNEFLLSNGKRWDYSHLDFTQSIRVIGSLRDSEYPYADELFYKDSYGDKRVQYVDSETNLELLIEELPPYLHRALRLGLVHDQVFVDGRRVAKDSGSYSPDISKESLLAPVIVTVTDYNQRDINKLC